MVLLALLSSLFSFLIGVLGITTIYPAIINMLFEFFSKLFY